MIIISQQKTFYVKWFSIILISARYNAITIDRYLSIISLFISITSFFNIFGQNIVELYKYQIPNNSYKIIDF
jgi:hypothetical protein